MVVVERDHVVGVVPRRPSVGSLDPMIGTPKRCPRLRSRHPAPDTAGHDVGFLDVSQRGRLPNVLLPARHRGRATDEQQHEEELDSEHHTTAFTESASSQQGRRSVVRRRSRLRGLSFG